MWQVISGRPLPVLTVWDGRTSVRLERPPLVLTVWGGRTRALFNCCKNAHFQKAAFLSVVLCNKSVPLILSSSTSISDSKSSSIFRSALLSHGSFTARVVILDMRICSVKKKSRVGACRSQHHVCMERGVDTCRLIDFPILASGQLPQPIQEWLGEANDQMLLNFI